jgi:hypothetical protein
MTKIISFPIAVILLIFGGCNRAKEVTGVVTQDAGQVRFVVETRLTLREYGEGRELPEVGVIPDAQTAANVGFAILARTFGREEMAKQLPLVVNELNGVWIVRGAMLPLGMVGGTAEMAIRRKNGEVLYVIHGV